MKKLLVFVFLITFAFYAPELFAFGGCEENCQKCHTFEKSEAEAIFKKINAPNAKALEIKMSPIQGLWEVHVQDNDKKGIMYVGFSKKFIMGGTIIEVDTSANKTQESFRKLNEPAERFVDVSKIPVRDALLMGDKNASHKVLVFTDPDCPFCGKLHDEIKLVLAERKDIAFYIKLMPLSFHPEAYWKSQSILCSNSIEMLEDNFQKKPLPKPKPDCKPSEVDDNIKIGKELDITGTPTMIMPDGRVVIGVRDAKTIIELARTPVKKEQQK